MRLRVLHVLPELPYPPVHGGRVDMWRRLCELSSLGHRVHVIATVNGPPNVSALREVSDRVEKVDVVPRLRSAAAALRLESFQLASRAGLAEAPLSGEYDAVILEQEFGAPILRNPRLRARRLIVRVHNDESLYAAQTARSLANPLLKVHFRLEAARLRRSSPALLRRADAIWFISRDDCRAWVTANPGGASHARWLPPPLDTAGFRYPALDSRAVLFAGNLVAALNLDGLNWYLQFVHPLLRDIPGYKLVVAGSLLGRVLGRRLRLDPADLAVELVTDAPDLGPLYAACGVFINPMRFGCGVKLKTINAIEHGLPVVTTPTGNQGTGMEDGAQVLVRNSAQGFAAAVRELLLDSGLRRRYAAAAQSFLREYYDHQDRMADYLQDCAAGSAGEETPARGEAR